MNFRLDRNQIFNPLIPIEIPCDNDFQPYDFRLTESWQNEKREKIENWLLDNRFVDQAYLEIVKLLRLKKSAWDMIKDNSPGDYHPLFFAYLLSNEENYTEFSRFLKFYIPDTYRRYMLAQNAWLAVAIEMHKFNQRRLPNIEERIRIQTETIQRPFRAYFVLKEEALGERVEYPWARERTIEIQRQFEHTTWIAG